MKKPIYAIAMLCLLSSYSIQAQTGTITTSGDTITYIANPGHSSAQITGLPTPTGCSLTDGMRREFIYQGDDGLGTSAAAIRACADPNRLHHLLEKGFTYKVRLRDIDGGIPGFSYKLFNNAAAVSGNFVSNVDGWQSAGFVNGQFEFPILPTTTSGDGAACLAIRQTNSNWTFFIPLYILGAADGQEEVEVLGQLESPVIPYMILHDPPGDFSSSTFSANEQYCTSIDISQGSGTQTSGNKAWKVGVKGSVNIFYVSVDFEAYYKEINGFSQGISETVTTSQEVCISYAQSISTADGIEDDVPIPPGDDLYIGSSVDMVYGVFQGWYFEDCKLKYGKRLGVAPDGDPEEVRYFESDIHKRIEELKAVLSSNGSDYEKKLAQKQIDIWEQTLAINAENKMMATEVIDPKKSLAGTSVHSASKTTQVSSSRTLNVDYVFENIKGVEWLAEAGGSGGSGADEYRTTQTFSKSVTNASTSTQEISYTIRDGEAGDVHTFEVYNDPVYGTPLFKFYEDESKTSCPYEGGAQRDIPRLEHGDETCTNPSNVINIVNVPPGTSGAPGVVEIPLDICNDSEETRTYFVKLGDNFDNAIVKLKGIEINSDNTGVEYADIPPGECAVSPSGSKPKLEIIQNLSLATSYRDIQVYLFPQCQEDLQSEITINVTFGSGVTDYCFADVDGDNITDAQDNCPTTFNLNQADSDGDGIGDVCDNCQSIANANQANMDGDAFGDDCDNCPGVVNDDQMDTDGDGIGDVCDDCADIATNPTTDEDGDGLICENCPDQINPGLHFDGMDDVIEYRGRYTDLLENVDSSFTYEFWVKPEGMIPLGELEKNSGVGAFVDVNKSIPFVIFPANGSQYYADPMGLEEYATLGVAVGNNGVMVVEHGPFHAPSTLVYYTPINDWTHIAVVYDCNFPRIYINGIQRIAGWMTSQANIFSGIERVVKPSFMFGAEGPSGGNYYPQHKFKGAVDDVRIWNGARTHAQIQQFMNTEQSSQGGDLMIYFNFNEGVPYGYNTQAIPFPIAGGSLNPTISGFAMSGGTSNYVTGAPINMYDYDVNGTADFCENPEAARDNDNDGIRNNIDDCDDEPTTGLDFDGDNDFVEIPNNAALAPTTSNAVTFEAWVKPQDTGSDPNYIASMYKNFDSGASNFFIRRNPDGTITVSGNGTNVLTSQGTIPLNTWSHVSVSLQDPYSVIYINGVVSESGSLNFNSNNGGEPLLLGHLRGGGLSSYFKGSLDEVHIWQGSRSPQNIDKILKGDEAGLLAYYNFSEGTPGADNSAVTMVTDQSMGGNHGTLNNLAQGGVSFDGINDRIDIQHNAAIDFAQNQNFTIELRIKVPTTPQPDMGAIDNSIIEKWNAKGYPYTIRYDNNSKKIVAGRFDGSNNPFIVSTSTVNDDEWHHIAYVKDGATLRLYVDGQEEGTATDNTSGPVTSGEGTMYLGCRFGDRTFFKGSMDELRFWNVTRTPTQIDDYKDLRVAGSETNLVGYYPLNQAISYPINSPAGLVEDKSVTGNNGMAHYFQSSGIVSNWTIGAPVTGVEDSDGDGSGDRCDLCEGDDTTGDLDMDGICNDIDPDYVVPCDGTNIIIPNIQYVDMTSVRAAQTISTGSNSVVVLNGADVTYVAQQSILLESGFQTDQGGVFTAYIDACAQLAKNIALLRSGQELSGEDLLVYADPSSDKTFVSYDLPQTSMVSLKLFDANGEQIGLPLHAAEQQAGKHTVMLDSSHLPNGVLVALLQTNQGVRYQRFSNTVHKETVEK